MWLNQLQRVALLAIAVPLFGACSSPPPQQAAAQPRLPSPGADGVYKVDWPDLRQGEDRIIKLAIGADVADICRIPKAYFEFDSSEPPPQEREKLRALADCLRTPPLDRAQVSLIGRADPRGGAEYNDELALRRAQRVKAILVAEGVPEAQIASSSTGKAQAVGDQPLYAYGFDRRVDVVLLGVFHSPR